MSAFDYYNTADDSERDDPWNQHPERCQCPNCLRADEELVAELAGLIDEAVEDAAGSHNWECSVWTGHACDCKRGGNNAK